METPDVHIPNTHTDTDEGYTPHTTQEAARMAKTRKARIQVDLIRLLLNTGHPEAVKAAQGILNLTRQGILEPGLHIMERIEPETIKEAQSAQASRESEPTDRNQKGTLAKGEKETFFIKQAMKLTKDPCFQKTAQKLVWGFMELLKAGAISCSVQDMGKFDKDNVNKALLTCLVDEFEDQKLEGNASKKDIMKLRDDMAVQH